MGEATTVTGTGTNHIADFLSDQKKKIGQKRGKQNPKQLTDVLNRRINL
jgi:hypothetical protein